MIEECHYIRDPDQVRLCHGARQLIASAVRHGWPVVLITNQSGITRGLFQWHHFEMVNERMQELLGVDAPLAAIYANGYGPEAPASSWRKPSPKMLLEAAAALNLDLQSSLLVGDRLSDLEAGAAAGVAKVFHVMSGYGPSSRAFVLQWHEQRHEALGSTKEIFRLVPALELLDTLEDFPRSLFEINSSTSR